MRKKLFLLLSLAVFQAVKAQNDLTLSFMENIFQSTYVNPNSMPVYKVSVGLPIISSVAAQFTNTGFSYGDLIQQRGDSLRGNIGNAFSKLDKENYLYTGVQTDLFHIRVKARNWYFSLFAQENFNFRYSYPRSFVNLLVNGNGNEIGQNIDFQNMGFDMNLYKTYGFGLAKESQHWIIGGNLKYLDGIANMSFDPGKNSGINFEDKYYAFHSTSNMTVNSSGLPFDNDSTFAKQYQDANGNISQTSVQNAVLKPTFKNPGAAIDLAVTYKPTDKWSFTASAVNLGFITWKSQVYNRHITGGENFSGFDLFGYFLQGQSVSNSTVSNQFQDAVHYTTSENKYKRWLVPQLYLTTKYNITYKTHLGFMTYFEYYKKLRPAFTFSVYHKFGRVFNIVGTYNIQYGRFDNIGLGIMAKLGPCQYYIAGDNLVAPLVRTMLDGFEIGHATVDPIKTFNIRTGINLVFGAVNPPNRQSYEYKEEKRKKILGLF